MGYWRKLCGAGVFACDSKNVDSPRKLVALLGVDNLVIVETEDALLIADRSRSQQVGDIVKLLEKQKRDHLL